jgi:hypothetical protein
MVLTWAGSGRFLYWTLQMNRSALIALGSLFGLLSPLALANNVDDPSRNTGTQESTGDVATAPGTTVDSSSDGQAAQPESALIYKVDNALSDHDWATVANYVSNGVANYFGHRNVSASFIKGDMESDAKTYKLTRTFPDRSSFHRHTKDGVIYESVQEKTEALEFTGRYHHATCLFEIAYKESNPPSLVSLSLTVLK